MVLIELQDVKVTITPNLSKEEYVNGVVHSVTKETITKYRN